MNENALTVSAMPNLCSLDIDLPRFVDSNQPFDSLTAQLNENYKRKPQTSRRKANAIFQKRHFSDDAPIFHCSTHNCLNREKFSQRTQSNWTHLLLCGNLLGLKLTHRWSRLSAPFDLFDKYKSHIRRLRNKSSLQRRHKIASTLPNRVKKSVDPIELAMLLWLRPINSCWCCYTNLRNLKLELVASVFDM